MKTRLHRRILMLLKMLVLFLLSVITFYFVFAVLFSFLGTIPPEQICSPKSNVFITSNGIHLDIVVPVENIQAEFLKKLDILNGTKYVSFGWGDQEFYSNTPTWSDLTIKTAFKALFLKSETAMHVTNYQSSYQSWKPIHLCNSQLNLLNRYIENSFTKAENGTLKKLNVEGYYHNDNFFEAKGSFYFYKTCNIWVNKALKEIGVRTSVWSPFAFGILYHLPD